MTAPRAVQQSNTQAPNAPGYFIPVRQEPCTPDVYDSQRIELVKKRWHGQDAAYLGYARTVEEHIRMLSGRQWDVWSDMMGRFVDVLQWFSEDEKRWRQRPVMDYLGYWFMLTLSKATENPPVISFLPATSDRIDAMLAEVMDPIWKTCFDEMQVESRLIRTAAWQLVAGACYLMTRVEFDDGPQKQLIGPAVLSLDRPDGSTIERPVDSVPYDQQGNPLAKLMEDPENPGEYGYDVTGEPWQQREGMPRLEVLCPLEVRSQWGQQIAWEDKQWIIHRWFLTPNEVERRWGVQCEPDCYPSDDEQGPGYLERMLFGTGYFGATRNDPHGQFADTTIRAREGYICGYTLWEKPDPKHTPRNEEAHEAGGRLLVVTGHKVLWDSTRPFATECAGPIRYVPFLEIPGRPMAATPLEKMVPLQKRLNRIEAQIAEHTNLCTNPVLLVHDAAGIDDDEWVARPGVVIPHGYNGTGHAAEWLAPPGLSADVWRHKQDVKEQLFIIGSMSGSEAGPAPTPNASGELVEQLRYNADRPLAPLTRNLVIAMADVAEDLLVILPTIWTEEKLLAYAGTDNVVRTVTVLPEMWTGRVNVRPSVESAAAESKQRKQERLIQLYQLGAFGNLMDPVQQQKATKQLLDMLAFPDLNRAMRPGGVDRVMAEHNLGRLVRGDPAQEIPILEVYDIGVHLEVTEGYMKSPEYVESTEPPIQQQFAVYRELLMMAGMSQAMNQIQRTAPLAEAQAAAAGAAQGTGAIAAGQPPGAGGDGEPGAPNPGPHSPSSPPRPDSRAA